MAMLQRSTQRSCPALKGPCLNSRRSNRYAADLGGQISIEPRVNDQILVPEVRLVGPRGDEVGIVPIETALHLARKAHLDLVEIAPLARPPIAQIMDYQDVRHQADLAAQERRRKDTNQLMKEIKDGDWP